MKKVVIPIITIFLLGLTMAIYPGEMITVEHNLGSDNLFYTIVDNSTQISALDVSVNSTHINITFPYDIAPDSFKIVLMEQQTNDVIKEVTVYRGGGGGTRTITKEVNNTIYLNDTRYYPVESEPEIIEKEKVNWNTIIPEESIEWRYTALGIIVVAILLAVLIGIINKKYQEKKRHNKWLENEFSKIDKKEELSK